MSGSAYCCAMCITNRTRLGHRIFFRSVLESLIFTAHNFMPKFIWPFEMRTMWNWISIKDSMFHRHFNKLIILLCVLCVRCTWWQWRSTGNRVPLPARDERCEWVRPSSIYINGLRRKMKNFHFAIYFFLLRAMPCESRKRVAVDSVSRHLLHFETKRTSRREYWMVFFSYFRKTIKW